MGGLLVGSLPNLSFRTDCPYTGCRICGAVYQSELDRTPGKDIEALNGRRLWSFKHAKTHTPQEHYLLQISGSWCTPEAAKKLAAFGVIALTDMVLSEEHAQAMLESSPVPANDAEGS
jgi:hypothetical protein